MLFRRSLTPLYVRFRIQRFQQLLMSCNRNIRLLGLVVLLCVQIDPHLCYSDRLPGVLLYNGLGLVPRFCFFLLYHNSPSRNYGSALLPHIRGTMASADS